LSATLLLKFAVGTLCEKDHAHAAAPDLAQDFVSADVTVFQTHALIFRQQFGDEGEGGRLYKTRRRPGFAREQRFDFGAQACVGSAPFIEIRRALRRFAFERAV
jgi:hypothetical protein